VMSIPLIDDRIKHVGPAYLRQLSAAKLKKLEEMLILQEGFSDAGTGRGTGKPLAVLIPYSMYLDLQKELVEGQHAIVLLSQGIDLTPRGQVIDNPDMEHSNEGYREPDIVNDIVVPAELPPGAAPIRGMPYIIDQDKGTPFQGARMYERVEEPRAESTIERPPASTTQATCSHCGAPSTQSPCQACYSKGHRSGPRCFKCAEDKESQRRAEQDSTGADRDDIDRLAFDQEVS
jgi:hypothetical protein